MYRKDFTTGEITNLMSVDTQRLMEVIPYINALWSGKLSIYPFIYLFI